MIAPTPLVSAYGLLVSADNQFFAVAAGFLVAGLVLLLIGLRRLRATRESLTTYGVAVYHEGSPMAGFPDQRPFFEWRDHLGVTRTSSTRQRISPGYLIGDKVPLRYLRTDPESVQIATVTRPGSGLLLIAVPCLIVAFLMFVVAANEWFHIHG